MSIDPNVCRPGSAPAHLQACRYSTTMPMVPIVPSIVHRPSATGIQEQYLLHPDVEPPSMPASPAYLPVQDLIVPRSHLVLAPIGSTDAIRHVRCQTFCSWSEWSRSVRRRRRDVRIVIESAVRPLQPVDGRIVRSRSSMSQQASRARRENVKNVVYKNIVEPFSSSIVSPP